MFIRFSHFLSNCLYQDNRALDSEVTDSDAKTGASSWFITTLLIAGVAGIGIFVFRTVSKNARQKQYQNPSFDNPIRFPEFNYDNQPI